MKKLFLAAAVLILAFAMLSCDDVLNPGAPVEDTTPTAARAVPRTMAFNVVEIEGGYATLEYAPAISTARALSQPLAKAATDFYEVVFQDDASPTPETSRRTFKEGQVIRMKVLLGKKYNNDDEGKAYIFAGLQAGKVLLGVGEISKIEYDSDTVKAVDEGTAVSGDQAANYNAGEFVIDMHTFRVWFEVEALTTDVKNDNDSTFYTWDPDEIPGDPGSFNNNPGKSVVDALVGGAQLPVFLIDKSAASNATVKINSTYASKPGVVNLVGSPNFTTKPFFELGVDVPLGDVNITPGTVTTDASGWMFPIAINPATPGKIAVVKIWYEQQVYLLSQDNGQNTNNPNGVASVTWSIQGGVSNPLYDYGPARDSQGGAILLGLGTDEDLSESLESGVDEDGFIVSQGLKNP